MVNFPEGITGKIFNLFKVIRIFLTNLNPAFFPSLFQTFATFCLQCVLFFIRYFFTFAAPTTRLHFFSMIANNDSNIIYNRTKVVTNLIKFTKTNPFFYFNKFSR